MISSADTLLTLPVQTVPHLDIAPVSNKILSVQILIKQSNQKKLVFHQKLKAWSASVFDAFNYVGEDEQMREKWRKVSCKDTLNNNETLLSVCQEIQ